MAARRVIKRSHGTARKGAGVRDPLLAFGAARVACTLRRT